MQLTDSAMNEPPRDEIPSSEPLGQTPDVPVPKVPARVIESTELLQGQREVVIVHQGEHYRLRLTRNDRLVLYK
jgi:hemin uptake protein HemP